MQANFIKVVDQKVEFEFDVTNHIEASEEDSVEDSLPELSSLKLNIQEEQIVDQPVYHDLGSDLGEIVAKQSEESPSDTLVHKETQIGRASCRERVSSPV